MQYLLFSLYLCFGLIQITHEWFQFPSWVDFISKAVLMPLLWAGCRAFLKPSFVRIHLLFALFFSWLGDLFLFFNHFDYPFPLFLLGLSSFLIAHVFYIHLFYKITKQVFIAKLLKWGLASLLTGYIYIYCSYIWPQIEGILLIAIPIYASTISIMVYSALLLFQSIDRKHYLILIAGALFFLISDSLIGWNSFKEPISQAHVWIMSTYILAQGCIAFSFIQNNTFNVNDFNPN